MLWWMQVYSSLMRPPRVVFFFEKKHAYFLFMMVMFGGATGAFVSFQRSFPGLVKDRWRWVGLWKFFWEFEWPKHWCFGTSSKTHPPNMSNQTYPGGQSCGPFVFYASDPHIFLSVRKVFQENAWRIRWGNVNRAWCRIFPMILTDSFGWICIFDNVIQLRLFAKKQVFFRGTGDSFSSLPKLHLFFRLDPPTPGCQC